MLESNYISTSEQGIIESHYLFWWLGREPSQRDFDFIKKKLFKLGAVGVKAGRNSADFRIFYGNNISLHLIILRKYWGFAINCHVDIGIHSDSLFNKQALAILSKIYARLKQVSYGKCFLLPRQEKEFEKFLKYGKRKWNLL